jgi:hypothetical protein
MLIQNCLLNVNSYFTYIHIPSAGVFRSPDHPITRDHPIFRFPTTQLPNYPITKFFLHPVARSWGFPIARSRAITRSPDLQVFNYPITKLPIYQIRIGFQLANYQNYPITKSRRQSPSRTRARRAKQPGPGAEAPGKWKRIDGAPEGAALFKLRKRPLEFVLCHPAGHRPDPTRAHKAVPRKIAALQTSS